jgi:hypothetical protein
MNLARAFLPALVLMNACGPFHRGTTRHDVYLIDGTASVVPDSLDQAIRAIESEADQFHRGDCVTVLPIMSDSDAIPSDQIVRMCVPTERQPYDQDLQDFRNIFHEALAAQRRQIATHRASRTDILGSLRLVEQEFALDGTNVHKTVAIFSDFIEEDTTINFAKAPELATPELAEGLADRISSAASTPKNGQTVEGLRVFLGNLQSNEIRSLPKQRREAIRRFWLAYFNDQHAHSFFAADGPGMSLKFLAQSE